MGMTVSPELWRMTRDNERLEDLTKILVSQSVDWDQNRSPGTAMAASFTISDPTRLSPLRDWAAPFLRIVYDDGSPDVYRQVGLFVVDQPDETHRVSSAEAVCQGRDVTWLLANSAYTDTSGSTAGGDVGDDLRAIAAAAGITRTSFQTNGRTLARARTFKIGSNRMTAMHRLANAINRYTPLADLDGTLTTTRRLGIKHTHAWQTFTPADMVGEVRVHPEDPDRLGNVVIVTKDTPDGPPLQGVAKNTDPADPISIPNIGYERLVGGGAVSAPDAETQADVDDYAAHLLEIANSYHKVVTLGILPRNAGQTVPGLNRLVRLRGFDGDFNGRYWCRSWKVGFSADNAMLQLTLNRLTQEFDT